MTAWGDSALLIELLDRQFEFLLEFKGVDFVLRLRNALSFIAGQPQLVAILRDFESEAEQVLAECAEMDSGDWARLVQLWATHEQVYRTAIIEYKIPTDYDIPPADTLREALLQERAQPMSWASLAHERTASIVTDLERGVKSCAAHEANRSQGFEGEIFEFNQSIQRLSNDHAYHVQQRLEHTRSLPWLAHQRLLVRQRITNPKAPPSSSFGDWLGHYDALDHAKELALLNSGKPPTRGLSQTLEEMYADARLLHEELRLRVGVARSRRALVERYAARCAWFDAERLRVECVRNSSNAERILTIDFARYLFDAGLTPLLDPTTTGLRPDVLHMDTANLFYVEAKQYKSQSPSAMLRNAYSQVWSTWADLRKTHTSTEAFLVVFRRGGPLVELPKVIKFEGLSLYSVVADISDKRGSRNKQRVITLTAEELQPMPIKVAKKPTRSRK